MSTEQAKAIDQLRDIGTRAASMKEKLLHPVCGDNGEFIPTASQEKVFEDPSCLKDTPFEGLGKHSGSVVMAQASRTLQSYCQKHGMPSDDVLASAHSAIQNAVNLCTGELNAEGMFKDIGEVREESKMILESAKGGEPISRTDGIIMRDRLIALVLPAQLQGISHRLVTHVPGDVNQAEIFKITRVAMSNFGGLKKDDVIDFDYDGSYSAMDQRWEAPSGDGTKKGDSDEFKFSSKAVFGLEYPLKKKRVRIVVDHKVVGADEGGGSISGRFKLEGSSSEIQVFGDVDYATGIINPKFSAPIPNGVSVHIGYDVNIERDPTLIPRIDHSMDSKVIFPHESAINAGFSLQALWGMRREHGIELTNLSMQALRNLITQDKDRKVLRDLWFFAQGNKKFSWSANYKDIQKGEHYQTVHEKLLNISTYLLNRNGKAGLTSLVATSSAALIFQYLPRPFFEPAPGYKPLPQPHYAGRLFGLYDLFIDPNKKGSRVLCSAKGTGYGEAGYIAGDAIPALSFRHPTLSDLRDMSTMWSLGYRDLHPFDGHEYFAELEIADNANVLD